LHVRSAKQIENFMVGVSMTTIFHDEKKTLFLVTPEPHIGPATLEQLLNNLASVGRTLIVLTWLVVGAAPLKKSIDGSRLSGKRT
jgi:hypothetical protein